MVPKKAFRFAWQPYVVAIPLIAVAAALRLWPLQALGVRLTWLTFYPAVMIVALYGGFSAGLLGTFLSCLTVWFLLPVFVAQPFIRDSVDWLGMAVFFITCTMISGVAEAMHRARAREKQANEQLEAANKELEAFSYSVSHDLRAPLRAIDGFSRILLEDFAAQLPAESRRYLDLVRANTQQMGHLVDDLLAFSRLSRQPLNKQRVAPADLVRQALADLRAEQEGRRVEIVVGDLPDCEGDPALLKQVFVNLLANALKYTRKREVARIEVGCENREGERVCFVRDNGVGFDMQYVGKLFRVFQRLHRAEEYEGTGVGLAIVQRIIQRHGGRAWAEAEVNQGATFYFTI